MERDAMPFFSPRISRIEDDFTDKMGLIYQISGNPTCECHDIHHSFIIQAIRAISGFYFPIQDKRNKIVEFACAPLFL